MDNEFNGFGVLTLPNGDCFSGEFKSGLPNGIGTWNSAEGFKYIGKFKDGLKHGDCVLENYPNGDSFKGIYQNGKKQSG